jgi:hypothetical protein
LTASKHKLSLIAKLLPAAMETEKNGTESRNECAAQDPFAGGGNPGEADATSREGRSDGR